MIYRFLGYGNPATKKVEELFKSKKESSEDVQLEDVLDIQYIELELKNNNQYLTEL